MKKSIISSFALFAAISVFSQTESSTLSGKLIKKPWSKTMQSYCAGGSDYFVLRANNNKETILDLSNIDEKIVAKKLNKKVALIGTWESTVKTNDDEMSQQPVNPPMCEYFIVKSLKYAHNKGIILS